MKKNKSKAAQQLAAAKGTRDLFGRLLFLSIERKIDLKKIFSFPLTPEPSCFANPDGSIRQSDKAKVFHHLKKKVDSNVPDKIDNVIIDGMFFLKLCLKENLTNFAALARAVLIKAMKLTDYRADLCFDTYETPSIKDAKRKSRGDEDSERSFCFGRLQKVPGDLTSMFKVAEFKKQLLRFLFREFEDQIYAPIIGNKLLYVSCDNECKKLFCVDGVLKTEFDPELYGSHEEGDTRVMFHAMHVDRNNPGSISVRANDTDILIVLLTSSHLLENSHLWFDTGFDSTNTRAWLDITSLSSTLSYTPALAGVYALTGCDYTPFFTAKVKLEV